MSDTRPRLICADVLTGLRQLPDESVQCCITSPPYWGLRAYGTNPQIWDAKDGCEHEWESTKSEHDNLRYKGENSIVGNNKNPDIHQGKTDSGGNFCIKCGAWRGELGLEPTPDLYVQHLVEIFREVRRVLHRTGVVFLNLGDSYASGKGTCYNPGGGKNSLGGHAELKDAEAYPLDRGSKTKLRESGLKPKDLVGIPWRVAFALQSDGWWLRSAIPWLKRNSMPESCEDRPSTAVEYIFLLAKSQHYFYDNESVKVSQRSLPRAREKSNGESAVDTKTRGFDGCCGVKYRGRNRRNTDWFMESWQGLMSDEQGEPLALIVNPKGYKQAHFATFPESLIIPMVKAGTSEHGCCSTCGAPWERVMSHEQIERPSGDDLAKFNLKKGIAPDKGRNHWSGGDIPNQNVKTLGWRPTCTCYGVELIGDQPIKPRKDKVEVDNRIESFVQDVEPEVKETDAEFKARIKDYESEIKIWTEKWAMLKPIYDKLESIPCTVLDPFVGSGTVCLVSMNLRRLSIGIDLNPEYIKMAEKRCGIDAPSLFAFGGADADKHPSGR